VRRLLPGRILSGGFLIGVYPVANHSQLGSTSAVPLSFEEIDQILLPLTTTLSREADAILDLRELLASQAHPGKCIRCFFKLFHAAGNQRSESLAKLQAWLEKHVEIAIRSENEVLEVFPFQMEKGEDLEAFCHRSMEWVRMDRNYDAKLLVLAFRYKSLAA
jgi:hypothetical protein